jgi:protein-S-isoprenylcysteine O-methyltransferase Ste14
MLLIYTVRTIQLKRNGTNIFVFGVGKMGLHAFTECGIYLGYAVWTLIIVLKATKYDPNLFPDSRFFNSGYFKIIGAMLVFLGCAGVSIATLTMKDAWRLGIDKKSKSGLVNSGIYTISRNPIYFFFEMYFLGTWLIYTNFNFLLSLIAAIIILHFQILQEEKFLFEKYGNEYRDYMKMVRRYI